MEQERSHNRALRNRVLHSREQSLKPRQENRAQDRDQERLRFPRTNLRRAILLRIDSRRDNDTEQTMVQQTIRLERPPDRRPLPPPCANGAHLDPSVSGRRVRRPAGSAPSGPTIGADPGDGGSHPCRVAPRHTNLGRAPPGRFLCAPVACDRQLASVPAAGHLGRRLQRRPVWCAPLRT